MSIRTCIDGPMMARNVISEVLQTREASLAWISYIMHVQQLPHPHAAALNRKEKKRVAFCCYLCTRSLLKERKVVALNNLVFFFSLDDRRFTELRSRIKWIRIDLTI